MYDNSSAPDERNDDHAPDEHVVPEQQVPADDELVGQFEGELMNLLSGKSVMAMKGTFTSAAPRSPEARRQAKKRQQDKANGFTSVTVRVPTVYREDIQAFARELCGRWEG
ncbi:MAG: hypothetical protein ABF296_09175 [Oceanococcaceae bacterium]